MRGNKKENVNVANIYQLNGVCRSAKQFHLDCSIF